jgi:hypothetical protein
MQHLQRSIRSVKTDLFLLALEVRCFETASLWEAMARTSAADVVFQDETKTAAGMGASTDQRGEHSWLQP